MCCSRLHGLAVRSRALHTLVAFFTAAARCRCLLRRRRRRRRCSELGDGNVRFQFCARAFDLANFDFGSSCFAFGFRHFAFSIFGVFGLRFGDFAFPIRGICAAQSTRRVNALPIAALPIVRHFVAPIDFRRCVLAIFAPFYVRFVELFFL